MQAWPKPKKELRSKIGRIATAVAFALVICSFGVGAARADEHHGDDRGRGGDQHHDRRAIAAADPTSIMRRSRTTITHLSRTTTMRLTPTNIIRRSRSTTRRRRPKASISFSDFDSYTLSSVVS